MNHKLKTILSSMTTPSHAPDYKIGSESMIISGERHTQPLEAHNS